MSNLRKNHITVAYQLYYWLIKEKGWLAMRQRVRASIGLSLDEYSEALIQLQLIGCIKLPSYLQTVPALTEASVVLVEAPVALTEFCKQAAQEEGIKLIKKPYPRPVNGKKQRVLFKEKNIRRTRRSSYKY